MRNSSDRAPQYHLSKLLTRVSHCGKQETFYDVQEVLDGKRKKTPKLSKPENPNLYLRKFLVCPVCGHILTGATSHGNGGDYTYYFCNNDHKHLNVRAEKLEARIQALRLSGDLQVKDKLTYSINLIGNLGEFFKWASPEVKIKLLGSIFPEKIEFDGKNYRTKSYNKMLDIIYQETKQLQGHKKKKSPKKSGDFGLVPGAGLEPAHL